MTPIVSGWGSSGGSQAFQILGPFAVAYNTPDLNNGGGASQGVALAALAPGTIVIKTWINVYTAWDMASACDFIIGIDGGVSGGFLTTFYTPDIRGSSFTPGQNVSAFLPSTLVAETATVAALGTVLRAYTDGIPTGGTGDIFAFVYIPA